MSTSDDVDLESLLAYFSGPLPLAARAAFRRAALDALAHVPCLGAGAIHRTVAALQRAYFDPPSDRRAGRVKSDWTSKLANGRQPHRKIGERFEREISRRTRPCPFLRAKGRD